MASRKANKYINQSINQSYTALSPILEVAGGSILKISALLIKNIASSHHAVLDSSVISCSVLFQIISPSFPWSSPWTYTRHILHKHLLYHPVISHRGCTGYAMGPRWRRELTSSSVNWRRNAVD